MNKLTKLLSVFVIAGAVGAGIAGIAGCKNNNSQPTPPPHTHTAASTWEHDETKHWKKCTADDGAKLEEGTHVYDNDQDTSCNTCGYTREVTPPVTDADVPSDAVGIKVTLATDTVELNADKTSTTLSADDLELQYIDALQNVINGSTVNKSNCTIIIMRGSDILALGDQLTKGDYLVMVSRNTTVVGTANFTVTDPVQAGTLALKADTTPTQEQGEDTISASLKWEVTLASGAKEEVRPTVTGIDTYGVGENKTANAELVMDGVTLTKEFNYTVTDKTGYAVQSAIINVNKIPVASTVTTNTDLGNGVVVTASSGNKQHINIDTSNKEIDGKLFTQRIKMEGTPLKDGALNGTTIYRTVQFADLNAPVDGATSVKTKITIYATNSSKTAARKFGLYKEGTKTVVDEATQAESTVPTLTLVEGTEKDLPFTIGKFEWTVEEAGTYHIASASGGWYVHYIRVDKIIEGGTAEEKPINAATGVTITDLEVTVPDTVKTYTVGDTFSTEGIQVLGVYANDVTCDLSKKDVSATATYSGYDMSKPGKQTVTIECEGKKYTYDITVETKIAGIYGAKAALKADVSTQVATADGKITLTKENIEVSLLGTNETATYTYTVMNGDAEITTGTELGIGVYDLTVTVTVTDGTNTETIVCALQVKVEQEAAAGSAQSFTSPDTLPTDVAIAADSVITENNLFKVVANGDMTYRDGKDANTPGVSNTSKPVTATLQDGTVKTFKSGVATAKSTGANAETTSVTITAKSKITLKLYAITCNDSYNSNKPGKLYYSVDGAAATSVATGSDRRAPNTIEVTLEANSTLTLHATGDAEGIRMYLFGVEAKAVA